MKLVIEIGDYEKDGKIKNWGDIRIVPMDRREGISTHDKPGQTEKFARLIDLSKALNGFIDDFYSKIDTSTPSQSINFSGEQGNT